MNKTIIILMAALIMISFTTIVSAALTDNLIAWYPYDVDGDDYAGTNDGTPGGDLPCTGRGERGPWTAREGAKAEDTKEAPRPSSTRARNRGSRSDRISIQFSASGCCGRNPTRDFSVRGRCVVTSNHSLERTRPARRDTMKESWLGRPSDAVTKGVHYGHAYLRSQYRGSP